MKWRDGFWTACTYIADTVIGTTANSLQMFGTIACQLGGALFSISYAIDETVTANYYATAAVGGDFNFNVSVTQYRLNIKNATLPFGDYIERNNGLTYNLQNYVSPGSVFKTSLIFVGSGTALKLLGANLEHWQNARLEVRHCQTLQKKRSMPSAEEVFYWNAEDLCDSLSKTLQIQIIASTYIRYSKFFNGSHTIAYPSHGNHTDGTYTGPVKSSLIPLNYFLDENITMSSTSVQIAGTAAATVNVTYGAELVFQHTANAQPPLIVPAATIFVSRIASSFFGYKARKAYCERMLTDLGPQPVYEALLSETDNTDVESPRAIMSAQ